MRIFCATRAKTDSNTAGILYKKDTARQMRAPGSSRETAPDEQSVASKTGVSFGPVPCLCCRGGVCFLCVGKNLDDRAHYQAREAHYWMFAMANPGFQSLVAAAVPIVHQLRELGADLI